MPTTSSLEYQLFATARVLQPPTGQPAVTGPNCGAQFGNFNLQHVTDDLATAENMQYDPSVSLIPLTGPPLPPIPYVVPLGTITKIRHLYVEAYPTPLWTYPAGYVPMVLITLNAVQLPTPVPFIAFDVSATSMIPAPTDLTTVIFASADPTNPINIRYLLVGE